MDDAGLVVEIARSGLIWVTKDDAARNRHLEVIQSARISSVWIRGAQRRDGTTQRNDINAKQLATMLVLKLDEIQEIVEGASGPRYFLLSSAGGRAKLEPFADIRQVGRRLANPRRTAGLLGLDRGGVQSRLWQRCRENQRAGSDPRKRSRSSSYFAYTLPVIIVNRLLTPLLDNPLRRQPGDQLK